MQLAAGDFWPSLEISRSRSTSSIETRQSSAEGADDSRQRAATTAEYVANVSCGVRSSSALRRSTCRCLRSHAVVISSLPSFSIRTRSDRWAAATRAACWPCGATGGSTLICVPPRGTAASCSAEESAGSICWFEHGVTDSVAGPLTAIPLSRISSAAATARITTARSSAGRRITRWCKSRETSNAGYAIEDGVAAHFTGGPSRAGRCRRKRERKRITCRSEAGAIQEAPLEVTLLPPR